MAVKMHITSEATSRHAENLAATLHKAKEAVLVLFLHIQQLQSHHMLL